MKNYKVSIAIKVPMNWVVITKAKSRREAIKQALEDFETENGDREDFGASPELDINYNLDETVNGVFAEKL